uniref:Fungal lipase-type domain-containing protein n=1 Tax=Populus davidiana TaxID=266767 RepID=A0A6M2F8F7_9ROSI
MPEIMEHLNKYGKRAKLQFTGHSLGGSLSLLVHLMLLTRKFVKPSTLRPVVTFGSPFVFCGGQKILNHLGLDDNHVHCVVMHRDIVPRAFSCNYPNHVALVLKRLSGSFQSHPCLIKNVSIYLINSNFQFSNHPYVSCSDLHCRVLTIYFMTSLKFDLHPKAHSKCIMYLIFF